MELFQETPTAFLSVRCTSSEVSILGHVLSLLEPSIML